MKQRASKILDVDVKHLDEFDTIDHFNNNRLIGVKCRHSSWRYGALVIFKVNEEDCEQVIYPTPKLDYPFDRNGTFHWPEIQQVEIYTKEDGTNILSYHYSYLGKSYLTFKTRMMPVVENSGFGSFYSLWEEYRNENNWVNEVIELNPDYNLSFELYGSRNPIMVKYEVPLEVALLFAVRRTDHAVKPPSQLRLPDGVKIPQKYLCENHNDLTKIYQDAEEEMGEIIGDSKDLPLEGRVFYAHTGGPSWRMYKAKPEVVKMLHWSAGDSIPRGAIFTTAMNAFEDYENPTIEYVIELLSEEFTQEKITKSLKRIEKVFFEAKYQKNLTLKVNEAWQKAKLEGLDVLKDKNSFFRFISKFFDKQIMRKVGTIVLQQVEGRKR